MPLLPASTAQPLTREQSRMAIGIVVGFLVLALIFAIWGLRRALPDIPARATLEQLCDAVATRLG